MDIVKRETYRYLGYKKTEAAEADEKVAALVDGSLEEMEKYAAPKHTSRTYALRLSDDGAIDFTCFQARSKNLYKNLRDCHQVILFAATLGTGADQLIRKYTKLEMSRAVVMQAAATALLEEYCDQVCGRMKAEHEERGLYLRPRFSPGYGDFPLECQKDITSALEVSKRIGITLTDSLIMAPSKSVTAVMGVSKKPYLCDVRGCEVCTKKDCAYRRE